MRWEKNNTCNNERTDGPMLIKEDRLSTSFTQGHYCALMWSSRSVFEQQTRHLSCLPFHYESHFHPVRHSTFKAWQEEEDLQALRINMQTLPESFVQMAIIADEAEPLAKTLHCTFKLEQTAILQLMPLRSTWWNLTVHQKVINEILMLVYAFSAMPGLSALYNSNMTCCHLLRCFQELLGAQSHGSRTVQHSPRRKPVVHHTWRSFQPVQSFLCDMAGLKWPFPGEAVYWYSRQASGVAKARVNSTFTWHGLF